MPFPGPRWGSAWQRWPILIGLAAVGFVLVWSVSHPPPPMLVIAGPLVFDCGTVPAGSFGRHPWEIRNASAVPLRLRTWLTSGHSGFSLWQGQKHVIPPGRALPVHLTWVTPTAPGVSFASYVILRTNDPDRPEIRLRVVGLSGPSLPPPESRSDPGLSPDPASRR